MTDIEYTNRITLKAELDAVHARLKKLLHDCEVETLFSAVQEEIDHWLHVSDEEYAQRDYDLYQSNKLSVAQVATVGRV